MRKATNESTAWRQVAWSRYIIQDCRDGLRAIFVCLMFLATSYLVFIIPLVCWPCYPHLSLSLSTLHKPPGGTSPISISYYSLGGAGIPCSKLHLSHTIQTHKPHMAFPSGGQRCGRKRGKKGCFLFSEPLIFLCACGVLDSGFWMERWTEKRNLGMEG